MLLRCLRTIEYWGHAFQAGDVFVVWYEEHAARWLNGKDPAALILGTPKEIKVAQRMQNDYRWPAPCEHFPKHARGLCCACYKRAYYRSPHGKAAQKKYSWSQNRRAAQWRYRHSPKGKAAQKKYDESPKGLANKAFAYERSLMTGARQEWLAANHERTIAYRHKAYLKKKGLLEPEAARQ
jgi:hypothetical protein